MDVWVSRRKVFALSAVGALAAALPSCSSRHKSNSQPPTSSQSEDEDSYDPANGYAAAVGHHLGR
jgi:hypothetical protein